MCEQAQKQVRDRPVGGSGACLALARQSNMLPLLQAHKSRPRQTVLRTTGSPQVPSLSCVAVYRQSCLPFCQSHEMSPPRRQRETIIGELARGLLKQSIPVRAESKDQVDTFPLLSEQVYPGTAFARQWQGPERPALRAPLTRRPCRDHG